MLSANEVSDVLIIGGSTPLDSLLRFLLLNKVNYVLEHDKLGINVTFMDGRTKRMEIFDYSGYPIMMQ